MRDFNGHTENIWKNLTDRMGCRLGDLKFEIRRFCTLWNGSMYGGYGALDVASPPMLEWLLRATQMRIPKSQVSIQLIA